MHPILISALVVFGAACLMYINFKRIAADIYIRTVRVHEGIQDELPASPYTVYPAKTQAGKLGFAIKKNDEFMFIANSRTQFTVYHDLEGAVEAMNNFEKLDRVRLTTLD